MDYLGNGEFCEYYSHDTRNVHVGVSLGSCYPVGTRIVWFGQLDDNGQPRVAALALSSLTPCNEHRQGYVFVERAEDCIPNQYSTDTCEPEHRTPFTCSLCGQRITDGKPCGCGAR